MKTATKLTFQEIEQNSELSEPLKLIAKEFVETTCDSELYEKISIINASHPNSIFGHLDIDDYQTYYSLPGCSIKLDSFEITEELKLRIHKTVTVGFNTNSDVDRFSGHDYIAPSVNNTKSSVEVFDISDSSDVLDVIDDICQRTIEEQIYAIQDLNDVKFENGESLSVLLDVKNRVDSGEKIKFSIFLSDK